METGTDGGAGAFEPRVVVVDDVAYRYQLWRPPGWSADREWPIVLFLHGAGERGDDGVRQTHVGLGPALRQHPERWPMLAVFPQSRDGQGWRGAMLRQALAALDAVLLDCRGDAHQQYLTGISMGAYGTWRLALDAPDRFAALVPICGGLDASPQAILRAGGDPAEPLASAARILADVPSWVFHGDADGVIPVSESRELVAALRDAGGDVHYTEYAGVAHNSWDRAYDEAELTVWLLAQER